MIWDGLIGMSRVMSIHIQNMRLSKVSLHDMGNFVRAKAGMSALANLDRVDGSIIQGHTHRLAITHHTRWTGQEMNLYTAIETGTMADLKGLGIFQATRLARWFHHFGCR